MKRKFATWILATVLFIAAIVVWFYPGQVMRMVDALRYGDTVRWNQHHLRIPSDEFSWSLESGNTLLISDRNDRSVLLILQEQTNPSYTAKLIADDLCSRRNCTSLLQSTKSIDSITLSCLEYSFLPLPQKAMHHAICSVDALDLVIELNAPAASASKYQELIRSIVIQLTNK